MYSHPIRLWSYTEQHCECHYTMRVYVLHLRSCLRSYCPIYIHAGTERKCTSESTSSWVYVMVVVVVTFMILVTLLAVITIIVLKCWKYSYLKTSIPLPKNGEYVTHQTQAYVLNCYTLQIYLHLWLCSLFNNFRNKNMFVCLNHILRNIQQFVYHIQYLTVKGRIL